jgi:hypothetical protein
MAFKKDGFGAGAALQDLSCIEGRDNRGRYQRFAHEGPLVDKTILFVHSYKLDENWDRD